MAMPHRNKYIQHSAYKHTPGAFKLLDHQFISTGSTVPKQESTIRASTARSRHHRPSPSQYRAPRSAATWQA
jgi:hypothetical protein